MTRTKADIVAMVYARGMLTKAEAQSAVENTLALTKNALARGEEVLISGFGKWSVRQKAERRGRNPQTGEPLILPPRKVVTFRPSRVLKAKVQGQETPVEYPAAAGGESSPQSPAGQGPGDRVIRKGYF